MATKDYCFDDNKIFQSTSNVDFRYCNLNLNSNLQRSTVDPILSKSVGIERSQGREKKINSWNKYDTINNNKFGNIYDSEEKNQKQHKRNNIIKNGMISMEISCYPQKGESDAETKKLCDFSLKEDKFHKPLFHDQHLHSPFEFIRQQDPQPSQPQVMNYKSSQRLLNPNAPQGRETFYSNLDNILKDDFEKTKDLLHWKPKGIVTRAVLHDVAKRLFPAMNFFIDAGTYGSVSFCSAPHCENKFIMKTIKNFINTVDIKAELKVLELSTKYSLLPKLMYAGLNANSCYCFVMECLSGGTLLDHIRDPKLTPAAIRVIALHVAKAVEFLHSNHLTHGDLKAENIGLTDFGIAKIFDFGKSRDISKPTILPRGSYDAPEVLKGVEAGGAADWFSYGCCFGYIIQKVPPFYHEEDAIFHSKILNEEPLIRIEDPMTRKFITDLLKKDPSKRLTSVLQEQYLKVDSSKPLFIPQKSFLEKKICNNNIHSPKEIQMKEHCMDLIISDGLIRFPTRKNIDWMNSKH
uniref:Protein kinase domain-containing protein n=1 Tax=Panagrolaimus davidi TaxID=227884 RepID=A0A914PCD2_9BILA